MVTTPYPGVTHEKHEEAGQRFHLVTIDRTRPSLSLHVSSETNRGQILSEIAKREKAVVAVNGQIFRTDFSLCGVAISRGVPWTKIDDTSCNHAMSWSEDLRTWNAFSAKGLAKGPFPGAPNGSFDVIGGYPHLVKNGVACDGSKPDVCAIPDAAPLLFKGPNPRTFLGVDEQRTRVFLVVVDGREIGSASGMTLVESARFMKERIGAWDAVNLDGGGSSALYVESEGGVVNVPSDGKERVIGNAIVLTYDPSKELPGDAAPVDTTPARPPGPQPTAAKACGCSTIGSRAIPPFWLLVALALAVARKRS